MHKRKLLALFFLSPLFVMGPVSMDLYLPVLGELILHFSSSEVLTQLTVGVFILGFGIFQLFVGWFIGLIGRNNAIQFGLFLCVAGCIFCGFSPNIFVLIFGRFLQSIGSCICSVVSMSLIKKISSDEKESSLLYTIATGFCALSPMFGPIISSLIIEISGSWRSVFLFLGIFAIIGAILFNVKVKPNITENNNAINKDNNNYINVIKDLNFWYYSIFSSFVITVFFLFFSLSPYIVLSKFKANNHILSLIFGLCSFCYVCGIVVGSKILKYFNRDRLIFFGSAFLVLFGLMLVVFSYFDLLYFSSIFIFCIYFVLGISYGPSIAGSMLNFANNSDNAASLHGFLKFIVAFIVTTFVTAVLPKTQIVFGAMVSIVFFISYVFGLYFKDFCKK